MANRLIHETSPYLQQHAHNPVDWYPWGEEALRKAKELDRPIFLSIGYSACHWCHVMEHESFEDAEIGQVPQRAFRQHQGRSRGTARPRSDLHDGRAAADAGSGGWPMSVFLTPDLQAVLRRHLLSAGRSLRPAVVSAACCWRSPRPGRAAATTIASSGRRTHRRAFSELMQLEAGRTATLGADVLQRARPNLQRAFDSAPRRLRPAPEVSAPDGAAAAAARRAALRRRRRPRTWSATRSTTWRRGGIYDQLGGGFHRYSTDARWLVPHFEKMLYDNALLDRRLPRSVTRPPASRSTAQIVEETLDYVAARNDQPRRAVLQHAGRRQRRRGRQVLRLVRSAKSRRCSARTTPSSSATSTTSPPAATGKAHNILHRSALRRAGREAARACRSTNCARALDAVQGKAARRARRKRSLAGPRREDPDGVERPDDRRVRAGRRRCSNAPTTSTPPRVPPTSC